MTLPDNDENCLAQLLDDYLRHWQQGDLQAAQRLLQRHPEVQEYAECLQALDQLSTLSEDELAESAPDLDRTVTLDGSRPSIDPQDWRECPEGFPKPFGKYLLLEELGRGGMGVVFRARDLELDREVAIKMLLGSQLIDDSQIARFQVEARAAAQMQHANVVSIHEFGQCEGLHFFCMDYVRGRNLAEVVREQPLDGEEAARILSKIAAAVEYLHRKGVVHRDLKPSNILIDDDGQPHVTDFGLAKLHASDSRLTKTGTIAGTPSYMAPEQAAGRTSAVGVRSDVYSMGAILYELLTGRPPFREETPLDTLVQVLEGEPIAPRALCKNVPADLERICLHCLEKAPEDRYASAAELGADLERFLKGEEPAVAERDWQRRFRGWARRKPALASHLSVYLLFAVVLQTNYQLLIAPDYLAYHLKVMLLLGVGAIGSIGFQRLLDSSRWSEWGRGGWALFDLAIVTGELILVVRNDMLSGPLLIAYPLLIVASGLWFREQIVGLMTAGSLLSFTLVLVLAKGVDRLHHHAVYAIALGVLGFMVGYQVKRVRALSRFYERRQLP